MSQAAISLEKEIKARATSLGFSLCGITTPGLLEHHHEYVEWLQHGYNADMRYLTSPYHINLRQYPEILYPGLKSIIVLGLSYPLDQPVQIEAKPVGAISGYATGRDYHRGIPQMVKPLLEFITGLDPDAPAPRVFTDNSPILERELAVRAGLGWIGRNSCLISPTHGSNILLSEIFTGIVLKPDPPFSAQHCGSCRRCIEACPTNCILPDHSIDANRCLSYHTIENKADIPPEIMYKTGIWIFGCDVCQMVCPWNHQSIQSVGSLGQADQMTVEEMLEFLDSSPADFDQKFGDTALVRARYGGMMRNIIIRLANLEEARALDSLRRLESSTNLPVLQRTAGWAIRRIVSGVKKSSE